MLQQRAIMVSVNVDGNIASSNSETQETANQSNDKTSSADASSNFETKKRLTVSFRDLAVHVSADNEVFGETLWSRIDPRQLKGILNISKQPQRVSKHPILTCFLQNRV